MTTSLKDVSSAQMIRALVDMNCFEQECTIYGYIWRTKDGKTKITTSEDEQSIYRSFEEKALKQYTMSPIRKRTTRLIFREETKNDMLFYLKISLSNLLATQYNDMFFNILEELQEIPSDSQAKEILSYWQKEIDGYFEKDEIVLFDGAVRYAYLSKHLSYAEFEAIRKWIQQYKKQISSKIMIKDNYDRTFYGFAYKKDPNEFSYAFNANNKAILDKVLELDGKGCFHTPIYKRTYYYHKSSELKDVRKKFEEDIRRIMDDRYLEKMNILRELTFAKGEERFQECMQTVEKFCSPEAVDGIKYWGNRWNLVK